jgi:hypothetical protein
MKSKLTIDKYGTKKWKLPSGKLHREDGPAYEGIDGLKSWWINGELHREDGAAVELRKGTKYWFLNGIEYTEKNYKIEMRSKKLNKLLNH